MVRALVASLIDPAAIRAAVTTFDNGDESTVWKVYAVAGAALAYVEVNFDQQSYTLEVEQDVPKYRTGKYATATVRAAWVRPVSRITEVVVDGAAPLEEGGRWHVAASVCFEGDEKLKLPDQRRVYREPQLTRTDELLQAIRGAISGDVVG